MNPTFDTCYKKLSKDELALGSDSFRHDRGWLVKEMPRCGRPRKPCPLITVSFWWLRDIKLTIMKADRHSERFVSLGLYFLTSALTRWRILSCALFFEVESWSCCIGSICLSSSQLLVGVSLSFVLLSAISSFYDEHFRWRVWSGLPM